MSTWLAFTAERGQTPMSNAIESRGSSMQVWIPATEKPSISCPQTSMLTSIALARLRALAELSRQLVVVHVAQEVGRLLLELLRSDAVTAKQRRIETFL